MNTSLKTIAVALLAVFSMSVTAQTKKVDVSKSNITWVGKKVTGQHSGTVNLKDGSLKFDGNKLTGGVFTVDMNSINVTDLKANEGKEKLEGHLKNDDFFGTEKYPTAKLVFKNITAKGNGIYVITADLTIKNKTNPVTFNMTVKGDSATTSFDIDRTKYDIKYGSGSFFDGLGDKTIKDNFDLVVNLQF